MVLLDFLGVGLDDHCGSHPTQDILRFYDLRGKKVAYQHRIAMTFLLRVIKIQLPVKIHGERFSRTAGFTQLSSYYSSIVQSSHQWGVRRDGDLDVLPSGVYELQQHFISTHGIKIHNYLNPRQSLLEKRSFIISERLALNTYTKELFPFNLLELIVCSIRFYCLHSKLIIYAEISSN